MNFPAEYKKLISFVTTDKSKGFDSSPAVAVPESLRFVHEIAGRMKLNQTHNSLIEPARLAADDEGHVVFAEESQGVVDWSYLESEADGDPMVYVRACDDEGTPGTWEEEGQPISRFLITLGYWSAAMGAADASGVGEVGETTGDKVEALPIVWETTDFNVRTNGHCLVVATLTGDLYVFGKDADEVNAFADTLDADWFDME